MVRVLFFIFFICSELTIAQESTTIFSETTLDATQETISRNLFTMTNRIDTLFGEKESLAEKNGSYISMEYLTRSREYQDPSSEPDLDIKVRLKNLEKRLNFKFRSVRDDEDETLQNQQSNTDESNSTSTLENALYRASLGFLREQKRFWSISVDTGVKVGAELTPFARARGRRSFYFGDVELRMVDRVLIEDNTGIFNFTDIDIKRKLSRDFTFIYDNKFVWKDSESDFTTSHGPSIVHEIDDKQSISYNFRTRFSNKPDVYSITGHELFTSYRRDIYKRWVFFTLTPGLSFLKENEYERVGFVNVMFQALFGDY